MSWCKNKIIETKDNIIPSCSYECCLIHGCQIETIKNEKREHISGTNRYIGVRNGVKKINSHDTYKVIRDIDKTIYERDNKEV